MPFQKKPSPAAILEAVISFHKNFTSCFAASNLKSKETSGVFNLYFN
jgi:hypothetical protein